MAGSFVNMATARFESEEIGIQAIASTEFHEWTCNINFGSTQVFLTHEAWEELLKACAEFEISRSQ